MGKTYLVLHKSEWDRLHRKNDDFNRLSDKRDEYFRKLIEQSQAWIKTWPDTVQGHVEKVAKQKEKRHEEEIAAAKKGYMKKKQENTKEAIKRARDMIFDNSCYGKQLLSALMDSKNLEIRDIQIEFQKELKEQKEKHEKELLSQLKLDECSFNLDSKEKERKQRNRETEIELANINKALYEIEINKRLKHKEEQIKADIKNAQLTQEMLEKEAQKEKEYEKSLRQDFDHYAREHQLARQRRADREEKEEARAKAQRNELQKKYCKINQVLKQIHGKPDTKQYQKNYETVKEIQQQKKSLYDEYVQKGVKDLNDRLARKEQEDAAKQKLELEKRKSIAKSNKMSAEKASQTRNTEKSVRQCIMPKSCYKRKNTQSDGIKEKPVSFLTSSNKLKEQLIVRSMQPTPWSALSATHAQFAERAGDTLREIRHKRFARKVVDEYRKLNCLDSTSLPVANY